MPFLRSRQGNSKKSTAHSLRAYLDVGQDGQSILSFCGLLKRVSLIISKERPGRKKQRRRQRKGKGSMTLEAAFVLPFFLFAVINILFAVNMIAAQSRINAALHQTGNKMALRIRWQEHCRMHWPVWLLRRFMQEGRFLHMQEESIWTSPVLWAAQAAYLWQVPLSWEKET